MRLRIKRGKYAVGRLKEIAALPEEGFRTLSVTGEEISLVCREDQMPVDAEKVEKGFALVQIEGTLDFGMIGVIAGISGVLAERGIPLFCVSTFDTDYFLVREEAMKRAAAALEQAGYDIIWE